MKRLPESALLLMVFGLLGANEQKADDRTEPGDKQSIAADKAFDPIDLQSEANQKLSSDFHGYPGNNLDPLPKGRQTLGEVEFEIGEKFIQLASKRAPDFPEKVEGIKVGRRAEKLHFLHSTGWGKPGVEDGTEIGSFVIHYKDANSVVVPIEYGRDVRDWWSYSDTAQPTRAKVVWTGVNDASKDFRGQRVTIRIFKSAWENPHPEQEISTIDYTSRNETISAPFLIAISTESSVDEGATAETLKRLGALLEYGDVGKVNLVSLSGPGPREGLNRGTDSVVCQLSDLRHLEKLYLNSSSVSDAGLECLSKLPRLRWLSLNITRTTDAGLAHLKDIETLERLRLHRTRITDAGLKHLTGLSKLEVLDLSETLVGDAGLEHLSQLTLLKKLDLRDTHVTDEGVEELKKKLSSDVRILH